MRNQSRSRSQRIRAAPKITDGYHEGRGVPKLKDELLTHPGKCFLKQGQKKKKMKMTGANFPVIRNGFHCWVKTTTKSIKNQKINPWRKTVNADNKRRL